MAVFSDFLSWLTSTANSGNFFTFFMYILKYDHSVKYTSINQKNPHETATFQIHAVEQTLNCNH